MNTANQRQHERIHKLSSGQEEYGQLFDLSASGMCCLLQNRLSPGDLITVVVDTLRLSAEVVYTRIRQNGFRTGLHFLSTDATTRRKLNETVERFSRGVAIPCRIVTEERE